MNFFITISLSFIAFIIILALMVDLKAKDPELDAFIVSNLI